MLFEGKGMETKTTNYQGTLITFMTLPGNDLLLKTKDVCRVLDIIDRPVGTELSQLSLDFAGAVYLAMQYDANFAKWLNETFAGYNLETLVRPECDDDWNLK
jgi:hypothetical protein